MFGWCQIKCFGRLVIAFIKKVANFRFAGRLALKEIIKSGEVL